jgi:hypothetical protein
MKYYYFKRKYVCYHKENMYEIPLDLFEATSITYSLVVNV